MKSSSFLSLFPNRIKQVGDQACENTKLSQTHDNALAAVLHDKAGGQRWWGEKSNV